MTSTNHAADTIAPSLPADAQGYAQAVATQKYIALANKLGNEMGYVTGWRGDVANKLGISGSLLSQIYKGHKRVTLGTLEKATSALNLPPNYFGADDVIAREVPRTVPPPPDMSHVVAAPDPLLIVEAFEVLPPHTQRRVLAILNHLGAKASD